MGRVYVLTGATRGIGRVATEVLAQRDPGARMVLLARGSSAAGIAEHVREAGAEVDVIETDLASLDSVAGAASALAERVDAGALPPPAALMLNAGVQFTSAEHRSAQGYETTFAVNVMANHVLLRHLARTVDPAGRIIVTVSDTHFGDLAHNFGMVPGPRWLGPEALSRPGAFAGASAAAGRRAYSTSKLGAIYLIHGIARQISPAGPPIVGYNPGLVPGTGLMRDASPAVRALVPKIFGLAERTPLASSQNDAGRWLAELVLGDTTAPSGAYVNRDRVEPSSDESYDQERERGLLEFLDEELAQWLPGESGTAPSENRR